MTVVVAVEQRFNRTPDGRVWTQATYAYDYLRTHYVEPFGAARVVARVRDVEAAREDWHRADGPGVTFAPLPYYIGPWQYARQYWRVRREVRSALGPGDAVILKVPSAIATRLAAVLEPGRPFAVQVIGDPYDVFAPGATKHPLRPFFRWWFAARVRAQCHHAAAASYVTRSTLQKRYPCTGYSAAFSDVQIPDAAIVAAPRKPRGGVGKDSVLTLVAVGSMENPHKAVDVQIDALAACVRGGLDARLVVVGGGRLRGELEARAAAAGVGERVEFRGQLPAGPAVRAVMDEADLFLMPSRTEGLPRALIEAMARALPCIGSAVGGIPELLPPEDLVPPGDAAALAEKIGRVAGDPGRMAEMSRRNLETAGEYRDSVLSERRAAFYSKVRELTVEWVRGGGGRMWGRIS